MRGITELKDHIYPKGAYVPQRALPRSIKSKFPELFETLNQFGDFTESLYCYVNNITEKPNCLECEHPVNFKSFTEGFRIYCSNKCVNAANSKSDKFKKQISKSKRNKFNTAYYIEKYGDVMSKSGENYILVDGTSVNKNKYNRLNGFTINDNLNELRNNFESIKYKLSENWMSDYMPNTYTEIKNWSDTENFQQKKWMAINNVNEVPTCQKCKKNSVQFDGNKFLTFCNSYSCRKSSSLFEQTVFDFVSSIYTGEIITNYRIENKEIDIFLPGLQIGIECNGLYWHSDIWKSKSYHQEKKLFFQSKGIDLICIWEDDWKHKTPIIQSIIENKLGKTRKRVFARKCAIKEIDSKTASNFLNENHLQGTCISKIRLGLYCGTDLMSVMTFGSRSIVYQKVNSIELLRFATKIGHLVVGGGSKLLQYFINKWQPDNLISFANFDISTGNLYQQIGFTQTSISEPGYWWSKGGYKFHRSNFMKHLLVKEGYPSELTADEIMRMRGYTKIWNSGNLVFRYNHKS